MRVWPIAEKLRWSPSIEAHHWSAKGKRFGHGEPRLVMEGGVEEHASRGNYSEKSGTVYTTFELYSVRDTPSMRSASRYQPW